jgi:hypothetical protein
MENSIVKFIYCVPKSNYKVKYQINLQKDWIISSEEKFLKFIERECIEVLPQARKNIKSSFQFIIDVKNKIIKILSPDETFIKKENSKEVQNSMFGIRNKEKEYKKSQEENSPLEKILDNYTQMGGYIPEDK